MGKDITSGHHELPILVLLWSRSSTGLALRLGPRRLSLRNAQLPFPCSVTSSFLSDDPAHRHFDNNDQVWSRSGRVNCASMMGLFVDDANSKFRFELAISKSHSDHYLPQLVPRKSKRMTSQLTLQSIIVRTTRDHREGCSMSQIL